jgi:hypothetical protein
LLKLNPVSGRHPVKTCRGPGAPSAAEALVAVQGKREEDGDKEQRPGDCHDDRVAGDPRGVLAGGVAEELAEGPSRLATIGEEWYR